MNKIKYVLTAIFLLTLLFTLYLLLKGRCQGSFNSKIKSKIFHSYNYLDNPNYGERIIFFAADTMQKNIVMLGNSHTGRIDWNELLNRTDIANRGIGSDITEGYMNRMNTVLHLKPRICFIEGGVNDITRRVPAHVTMNNLKSIVDTLVYNSVTPVLTTVPLVAESFPKARAFNKKVTELNARIISSANERNIALIDLNPILSDDGYLMKEYAESDGIHLTDEAYSIWRNEIAKVLVWKMFGLNYLIMNDAL